MVTWKGTIRHTLILGMLGLPLVIGCSQQDSTQPGSGVGGCGIGSGRGDGGAGAGISVRTTAVSSQLGT